MVGGRASFRSGTLDLQVPSLVVNEIAVTHLTELVAERGDAQGKHNSLSGWQVLWQAKWRAHRGRTLHRLRTQKHGEGTGFPSRVLSVISVTSPSLGGYLCLFWALVKRH